jgi:uncharacterized membrane protein
MNHGALTGRQYCMSRIITTVHVTVGMVVVMVVVTVVVMIVVISLFRLVDRAHVAH